MTYKPVDTAIVMVVGPCIDDTDFKTLEEAIAYDAAGMDVSLIVEKTDGTTAVTAITLTTGGTSDWTHKDGGYYEIEVTAAQNAEEGIAYIRGVCTGVLPFESIRYNIVKANVYDSWIKGTDALQVDAIQISGDAGAADNAELAFDGTGYGFANCVIPTVSALTGHTAQTGDSFARIGATGSSLTSLAQASICTDTRLAELDAANLPADLDSTYFATSSIFTIVNSGVHGNAALKALIDTIDGIVDSILEDTAEIGAAGASLTDLGGMSTAMKAEVNVEATDVLTVDTIADSYSTDGSQPTIAQALLEILQMMQEKSISGTTLTVKKPDGSTTAMTFTLDSATAPTSVTRAT